MKNIYYKIWLFFWRTKHFPKVKCLGCGNKVDFDFRPICRSCYEKPQAVRGRYIAEKVGEAIAQNNLNQENLDKIKKEAEDKYGKE